MNNVWDGVSLAVIIALTVLFFSYVAPMMGGKNTGTDCYIEWDGRSNPTVCD